MSFQRITDKAEMREVLHGHLLRANQQRTPFVPVIFSREHRGGGWIYEGSLVVGSCTTAAETVYTIAIDGFRTALKLSQIEYIELLR